MTDVLQVIKEANDNKAFVSSQAFYRLRGLITQGSFTKRIDIVQRLSESEDSVVRKAVTSLPSASSLWAKPNPERQIAACLRDCEIILRYITYALLAGDASILDNRCLNGLRETYTALGVSTAFVIQAVNLMRDSAIALIRDDDLAAETAYYFNRVVASLEGGAPEPLWKQLVAIGRQVSEEEWAKLPTDLSRNFEHYMYGAPKEE